MEKMRKILFRGKDCNGKWIYGYYCHQFPRQGAFGQQITEFDVERHFIITKKGIRIEVAPETVGQYTGFTDKNGTKIFEGDIVKFREWSKGTMCWIGKVYYEKCQFLVSGNPNKECNTLFTLCMSRFVSKDIKVIGNVFDNFEKLKVKI